jgi:CRP/FNR family cyclic AMP-dependent transcriptional regulator
MLNESDFFGEMSLLDGMARSATVTAVEDSKFLLFKELSF